MKANTERTYSSRLRQFQKWKKTATTVGVVASDIEDYLWHRRNSGFRRSTITTDYAALKARFSEIDWKECDKTFQKVIARLSKIQRKSDELKPNDLVRIALYFENSRDEFLIRLMHVLGMRRRIVDLFWSDFEYADGDQVIRVRGRPIPKGTKCYAALVAYLNDVGANIGDPVPVFVRLKRNKAFWLGTRMKDDAANDLLQKYCKKAGITKRITTHSSRIGRATLAAHQGVAPASMAYWMGVTAATASRNVSPYHDPQIRDLVE